MVHKLHIMNNEGKPYLVEKAYHQTDIYKSNTKRLVTLKLHPTVLQVVLSPVQNFQKKNELGKTGSINVLPLPKKKDVDILEEEKKMFEEDFESQNQPIIEHLDLSDEENLFNPSELEEELDLTEYENSEQNTAQNMIMTPFKGSMLGGTVIGEGEESAPLMPSSSLQTQSKQHFIYLNEIDQILVVTNSMLIVKKNQDIEKFIFKNEEKLKELLIQMKKCHKDNYKQSLHYINIQEFEKDKIFDEIQFLKYGQQIIHSQEVQVNTWDGVITGVQVEIDENYIYEVDKASKRVRKRCLLKDLEMIRIQNKQPLYNLVLLFKKETEMVLKLVSVSERDKLLSALLTARSFIFPSTGVTDQVIVMINSGLDFAQRILGHEPVEKNNYTQEYEGLLFRKISENINYKDNMKLSNLIEEALLNSSFMSLAKIDIKNVRIIVKEIQHCLEQFLNIEINEANVAEQALKRNQSEKLIEYLGSKKKPSTQSQLLNPGLQDNLNSQPAETGSNLGGNMILDDINEKIKQYEILTERLCKYLNVFSVLLNSESFLVGMQEQDEVMLLLIKCLMSKNPYIAFLCS